MLVFTFMSFLVWYYTKGLLSLFSITRNLLWFLLEFFSIQELFLTLFSPWHRDVSQKYWRGFDPVRLIQLLAENALSRVIGSMVRFSVIVVGLTAFILAGIFSVLVFVMWVTFPVAFLAFLVLGISEGSSVYWVLSVMVLSIFLLALMQYLRAQQEEVLSRPEALLRQFWFSRVLNRVGIEISKERLHSLRSLDELGEMLREHHVPEEDFQQALTWEQKLEVDRKNRSAFWKLENLRKVRPIARQWRFGFTPNIDRYGFDILSRGSFEDMRVCAHPRELESMKMTLLRPEQNCVLLVAPSGTGKKSIIQFLAKQTRERSAHVFSPGERLINIDLDRVFSARNEGEYPQETIEQLFSEAVYAGNITLVIENIDRYMGEGAVRFGTIDLSSLLVKYLPIPSFRIIATVSGQGYHDSLERNEGILQYLEIIELEAIDDATALSVLLDFFDTDEKKTVVFTIGAFRTIIRYSGRFHPTVPLPERALDVAKETALYWQQHPDGPFITQKTVDTFVSFKTGVPLGDIQVSEKEKLVRLEKILAERVVGQPEAVRQVARALKRSRAGMSDSTRAIGSFLFLGPTGVGKTELAKVLSKAYFGKTGSLVRLDMSEFQSSNAVDRLMGSRDLNIPGQLTTMVRDHPYGVLLLDELEKADGGVLDLFLQILDEGFFTDAFGQKVIFTNLIIIATSNAGANVIKERFQAGMDTESVHREIIEYITDKNIFRVEFLNRFDGVIFFRPIAGGELIEVCKILLSELADSIKKNRGIILEFQEGVPEKVVELGYDPVFGARAVKRFIAETVESKIADVVIERNPSPGDIVVVRAEDI